MGHETQQVGPALDVEAAAAYHERHVPHALLVLEGGRELYSAYAGGYDATKPHLLYSGTKSFWGVSAVAAMEDGLLDLDEPVAATFSQWNDDARKRRVTLRMLLSLCAGVPFGGLGNAVPPYDAALAVHLKDEPATSFTYGGIPLQIFGAVLARKLAPAGMTPHAYLRNRILDRIGCTIAAWRVLKDGTSPLPTGASMTAPQWARYGRLIAALGTWNGQRIISESGLSQCFEGSRVNEHYGLGFWLRPIAAPEVFYASGAAGQAMYIVPSRNLVVVRFGKSTSFSHETFLRRLFGTRPARRARGS